MKRKEATPPVAAIRRVLAMADDMKGCSSYMVYNEEVDAYDVDPKVQRDLDKVRRWLKRRSK